MKKLILILALAFVFVGCTSNVFELPNCWGKKGVKKAYCKAEQSLDDLKDRLEDRKEELLD